MTNRITKKERLGLENNPDMSINELRAINEARAREAHAKLYSAGGIAPTYHRKAASDRILW